MAKSAETGGVEDVKTMHCSRKPETSRVPDLGDVFSPAGDLCRIWNFQLFAESGNPQRWLVQSLDTAYIVLFDVFLSGNGGCLCSLSVEHLGHNWNLIMASPVKPLDLFIAKFAVVAKLALLTHIFVFVLYVFCGKIFAHLSGWPSMRLPFFLLRGAVGALAVIAAQLVLAMMIRSFAVPIFLGLVGGVTGMFAGSKGFALAWPYCLMQAGMNANKKEDVLSGGYGLFVLSCVLWLMVLFVLAGWILKKKDVRA